MTVATWITLVRLVLVPIFLVLALAYSTSLSDGSADPALRWAAIAVFVIAAVSDALDGWVARRFHQHSELGAFLDPIADKALLLTAILVLAYRPWGPADEGIPIWFLGLVLARDALILGGLGFLRARGRNVRIAPDLSGKACTVAEMAVVVAAMLALPRFPAATMSIPAGILVVVSGFLYFRTGLRELRVANRQL